MEKTHWGLVAVMVVTALGAGLFFGLWRPRPPEPIAQGETRVVLPSAPAGAVEASPDEWLVVHVAGRVLHPGLVRVRPSARVGDAIGAAGGALSDARLGEINLAAPVFDGDRVVVPGPATETGQEEVWTTVGANSPARPNLNRASAQELEKVPGVGPVLAARIVDHRVANGPFQTVEDLLDVPGIGEKKLSGIRDYVVLP